MDHVSNLQVHSWSLKLLHHETGTQYIRNLQGGDIHKLLAFQRTYAK